MLDSSNSCKKLAEFLHKYPLAKMMLDHEFLETGHYPKAIPQANDTRWDSRCSHGGGLVPCRMLDEIDGHTISSKHFRFQNDQGRSQSFMRLSWTKSMLAISLMKTSLSSELFILYFSLMYHVLINVNCGAKEDTIDNWY